MKTLVLSAFLTSVALTAQDLSELERDARALEIYLQDKKDHEKHCPTLRWDQPPLDTYKKELTSQLPEGCK